MSSPNYHSTVIGHRRSHHKPAHMDPIIDSAIPVYHTSSIISATQPSNNPVLTVPGGQANSGYVNIPANVRKRNAHEQERLNEPRFAQETQRDSFAEHFHDFEWKTRNVKPWQWGVGAGAATFFVGILFVDGVAAGIAVGLSRLVGIGAGASSTGAILSKIDNETDRAIMQKAIELGRGATTFMDRFSALSNALKIVANKPNAKITFDMTINAAYGVKNGYGIAQIDNITYIVRVHAGKIVDILGKFP